MKKIILIPAYEPDEKLIELIHKIDKKEFDIIIVDDGSGTNYDNIFLPLEKEVKVIRYKTNKGKGHALKKGFHYIKETYKKDYITITMDSDGQHTIKDAKKLERYVESHPNTLVLGMRLRDKKIPLRSRIGNGITKFIYNITTGLNVYDTQTGLRAFSDKLMDILLNIEGERFEYEMNVLLQFAKLHIPIKEIQIETIYIEKNKSSHFNTIKDSYRIYKEIIKFSCSSIISFIIDYILFIILSITTNKIIVSNIIARIISASTNYLLNKNYVFKSKKKTSQSIISYAILALFILIANSVILNFLISKLLLNKWISKLLTEIILFTISWLIQKNIIFHKEYDNKE